MTALRFPRLWIVCLGWTMLFLAGPAAAEPNFPQLTGRVVDHANIIPDDQEPALVQKLEHLQQASSRQLVVVTVPDLQGYAIEEFGYQLGRHWQIGQSEANNGTILLVAPNERKVRIEVGYGLEPILTDALSNEIIQSQILPRFRDNGDYAGGINAGVDGIIAQLQAPPEAAEQRALEAQQRAQTRGSSRGGSSIVPLLVWGFIILFIILPAIFGGRRGRRYRGRRRGRGPVVIWGGSWGGGGGGWGGSSWGGGGGGWGGGGGGGFSGGGGSFGGGGASGSW